jgi:hypothetical protein
MLHRFISLVHVVVEWGWAHVSSAGGGCTLRQYDGKSEMGVGALHIRNGNGVTNAHVSG